MRGRGKKVESARHDILHEHNSSPGVTMLQQVIKMRGITSVRERSNRSWFSCGLVLLILAAVSPTCSRTAFSHAPVCAPSRSGLVTGMYPTTIGSHHMRSRLIKPPETFMSLTRKAGYYVAWPGKTDFNWRQNSFWRALFAYLAPSR